MCFLKSKVKTPKVPKKTQPKEVVRHQADAEATKLSPDENRTGYKQNIKTSIIGLSDDAITNKKTLLGD